MDNLQPMTVSRDVQLLAITSILFSLAEMARFRTN